MRSCAEGPGADAAGTAAVITAGALHLRTSTTRMF